MGLIAELLEWVRGEDGDAQIAEGKVDPGGGDVLTAVDYTPAGFDGQPVHGDYVLLAPGPEAGSYVMVGYVDPKNAGTARAGEVSLYLRDGDGAVQGELYLASDEPEWKAAAGAQVPRDDHLQAELDKLKDVVDDLKKAINTHQHAVATGCLGTAAILAPFPANPATETYAKGDTASDKGWVT